MAQKFVLSESHGDVLGETGDQEAAAAAASQNTALSRAHQCPAEQEAAVHVCTTAPYDKPPKYAIIWAMSSAANAATAWPDVPRTAYC